MKSARFEVKYLSGLFTSLKSLIDEQTRIKEQGWEKIPPWLIADVIHS